MSKKYLVLASRNDPAGMNIVSKLAQFNKPDFISKTYEEAHEKLEFDMAVIEKEVTHTENLDPEKLGKYDLIIFASKHSTHSEEKKKTFSIHSPGNFREARLGGIQGKVSKSSALFNKFLFQKLKENSEKHHFDDYDVTLEVTHHGPLIDIPCVFIEIGSSENEWGNPRAGFVIAKTIKEAIEQFKEDSYKEIAIGIGGPHYCPSFNKLQLKTNVAISHIIPNYVLPITEDFIKECISKTREELDFVVLDWKGLGPSDKRQEVIDILEKNYLPWKKSSDIDR